MMVTLNILLFPEFELYEVHMVMITSKFPISWVRIYKFYCINLACNLNYKNGLLDSCIFWYIDWSDEFLSMLWLFGKLDLGL